MPLRVDRSPRASVGRILVGVWIVGLEILMLPRADLTGSLRAVAVLTLILAIGLILWGTTELIRARRSDHPVSGAGGLS